MTDAIITEGRLAWRRIKDRTRATFDDWVKVGKACSIGRAASLKAASTNKPYGKVYNQHMTAWLAVSGLAEIRSQERYWALQIVDHLDDIVRWRDALDDAKRRKWNHPQAIWVNWRGSTSPRTPHTHVVRASRPKMTGRPFFFDQDMIRRAAMAMRESRSADFFTLARVALEAAIRSETDITELLETRPRRTMSALHSAPEVAPDAMLVG